MRVHLVDGTYELFRHHFAVPSHVTTAGEEVGAVRATAGSILSILERGATHVGVATDHVIESFRNGLWPGYKSSAGVPPELLAQFPVLEDVLEALGLTVWAMVEHEADDALASAARVAAADDRVDQVVICTPDKDLGQCVGGKVVQLDRRKNTVTDAAGVVDKFGVPAGSITDFLALVGDSADGYPGLKGWGRASTAAVLRGFRHIEDVPDDPGQWKARGVTVRGAASLAATLRDQRALALLFKELATLRDDLDVGAVDEWQWRGPADGVDAVVARIDAPELAARATALAAQRSGVPRS